MTNTMKGTMFIMKRDMGYGAYIRFHSLVCLLCMCAILQNVNGFSSSKFNFRPTFSPLAKSKGCKNNQLCLHIQHESEIQQSFALFALSTKKSLDALPKESIEMQRARKLEQNAYASDDYKDNNSKIIHTETENACDSQIPKKVSKLSVLLSNMKSPETQKNDTRNNSKNRKEMITQMQNEVNSNNSTSNSNIRAWNADFLVSRKTQAKIKAIASQRNMVNEKFSTYNDLSTSLKILTFVLDDIPHDQCNEINMLYALSLSSKIYPPFDSHFPTSSGFDSSNYSASMLEQEIQLRIEFRSKLLIMFEILSQFLSEKRLKGRQLTNAAWAIVRHYITNSALDSYDEIQMDSSSQNSENCMYSSSFSFQDVSKLLDSIALQIQELCASSLETTSKVPFKAAELSMTAWAYACLNPRDCPTGWHFPPKKLGKQGYIVRDLGGNNEGNQKTDMNSIVRGNSNDKKRVIFYEEALDLSGNRRKENGKNSDSSSIDSLFDMISKSFLLTNSTDSNNNLSLLQQCTWRELSNLAWSFATYGYGHNSSKYGEAFISELAEEVTKRILLLKDNDQKGSQMHPPLPRDLSMFAWSLGVIQVDNYNLSKPMEEYIDAIIKYMIPDHTPTQRYHPLENWKNADIVQLAISLAHSRIDQSILLHELFSEALLKVDLDREGQLRNDDVFSISELSALLWVQAKLYLTASEGEVYTKFAESTTKLLSHRLKLLKTCISDYSITKDTHELNAFDTNFGPQEQANLAWSMTVLEIYTPESIDIFQHIFASASSKRPNNDDNNVYFIQVEHAHQLWQAYFILKEDCAEAVTYVPTPFIDFLRLKWDDEKSRDKTSSHRHRALSQTLDFMRVAHHNEHEDDIDIAIVLNDDKSQWTHLAKRNLNNEKNLIDNYVYPKVAVEFDGPTHFTRTNKKTPRALGHTVMKYRMLKIKGWTVVRIPFYEFDKIPFWASMVSFVTITYSVAEHLLPNYSELIRAFCCFYMTGETEIFAKGPENTCKH